MTRADEEACSSDFSSSDLKRTYSSFEISYPLIVSSRGTGPWIGHSRRIWIRLPHLAWRRWKATPCEVVAVKSWTGITARPRVMSRFLMARGMALVGGYVLGITSERKLVMELQCNMALRWFAGLNLDQDAWDASTFSQNRRCRFDESGVLERLFDATIKQAMTAGLVSRHVSADGTLVRANASYKSFLPIEVAIDPEEYKH